jgi:hypothetical protein
MNNVNMHSNLPPRNLDETTLTKREHFAAMAMQGLLSNPKWVEDALTREGEGFYSVLKYAAYSAADKMLNGE